MNKFIKLISEAFAAELAATKAAYAGYDPFAGHTEDDHSSGKSYFITPDDSTYLVPDGIKVLAEETPDDVTRIIKVGFTATWDDPQEPAYLNESGHKWTAPCGKFVCTNIVEPFNGHHELKVRRSKHGELQFFGIEGEWVAEEEGVEYATVILNKENGVWLLATAFPGPASSHNDPEKMEELAKREYIDFSIVSEEYPDADLDHVQILEKEAFRNL